MEQFQEDKNKFEEAYQLEVNYLNKFSLLLSGLLAEAGDIDRKAWQQCEKDLTSMSLSGNRYVTSAVRRCIDTSYRDLSESNNYLMEKGGYNKALKLAEAWTSLQLPEENPWYLAARAAAMMEKKKMTEKYLKEAVQNPRFNKERVLNDKILLKLFKPEELKALLNN